MSTLAIEARSLSKRFVLRHNRAGSLKARLLGRLIERDREVMEDFWALKDISLSVGRSESVGIIGHNGSGKSTLLRLIAGVHRPTAGQLLVARDARIGTMIELGVGFHPDLTGAENVYLNAAIHGLTRQEIEAIYPSIVEYSGLERFMDVAIKNYSSGMSLRLGFSVAANLTPDILLLDEVFAVGDADFQRKCMNTMEAFRSNGCTIVFVSHAPSAVRAICQRVVLLDHGRLLFAGDTEDGLREYERIVTGMSRRPPEASRRPAVPGEAGGATLEPDSPRRTSTALAEWTLDFLKRQGLQPHHHVVEVGIELLPAPSPLVEYLGDRYSYWQAGMPAVPGFNRADFVILPSVFQHFTLNLIALTMAMLGVHVSHTCRVFATHFDASGMDIFYPTPRANGVTTFAEHQPFQSSFEQLSALSGTLSLQAARVADSTHPDGESVILLTRV